MAATVCTVSTLRAPTDIALAFVYYHLNRGVARMFLYFDDPGDLAIDALDGEDRVTCVRCDDGYWPGGSVARGKLTLPQRQWYNANDALRRARNAGFDWIIHLDSDELIFGSEPLGSLLANMPSGLDIVRFRPLEAIPEKLEYKRPFEEITLFKVGPARPTRTSLPRSTGELAKTTFHVAAYYGRLALARLLGCKTIKKGAYLRGHVGGKSAVRIGSGIRGMGVHLPAPAKGGSLSAAFTTTAALLHFDAGDYASWKSKWIGRYEEKKVPPSRGKNRARQLREFAAAFESRDERKLIELYKRQYWVPEREQAVLRALGLIKRVRIASERFQPTVSTGHQTPVM